MADKPKADPNQNAARIVGQTTRDDSSLPTNLEAAWEEWSRGIRNVDKRTKTLLRAAFEAGAEAAQRTSPLSSNPAAELGRMGGLKGGKARAESLSKAERSRIAQKAAAARWKAKPGD